MRDNKHIEIGSGYATCDYGLIGQVVVSVDVQALIKQIGHKAVRSKRHKTMLAHGAIKLVARNIKRQEAR